MKGVINRGVQELVLAAFGQEAWESIKAQARCPEPFFSVSRDYPDDMTLALVHAISMQTKLSPDEVLVEFGKHWLTQTATAVYPHFVQLAGSTAREFLLNMDSVHRHATNSIPHAHPPSFEYEELPNGKLRMRYRSQRQLCPALYGLILGVGIHFGETLEVRETDCIRQGAEACVMEVSFDDK